MSGLTSAIGPALAALALALACLGYAVLAPGPQRLPLHRRRPGQAASASALTDATGAATRLIDRVLQLGGRNRQMATVLERAGVSMPLQEVVLLVGAGALVAGAVGVALGNLLVGLVLAALTPLLARVYLGLLISRRERAFADQLDDSLQLMASSLRAGHSLLQALAAVATEAEKPTSEEFSRVINETRVGRELGQSLEVAAQRMNSQDFVWVTQGVAINREVGGNVAAVLDGVSETIRERNALRRQVKTLAAEGKLSAVVLMALPFCVAGFLLLTTPGYLAPLTHSLLGYGLLAVAVVLFVVGGLWMRKSVQVRF